MNNDIPLLLPSQSTRKATLTQQRGNLWNHSSCGLAGSQASICSVWIKRKQTYILIAKEVLKISILWLHIVNIKTVICKRKIIYYLHLMVFTVACCLKQMIKQLQLISLIYRTCCIQCLNMFKIKFLYIVCISST